MAPQRIIPKRHEGCFVACSIAIYHKLKAHIAHCSGVVLESFIVVAVSFS